MIELHESMAPRRVGSYRYAPLAAEAARYRWTPEAVSTIADYNLLDLFI